MPAALPWRALLAAAERALNRVLSLDPEALRSAQTMHGRLIAIELLGVRRTLYLIPHAQGIRVLARAEEPPAVTLRGTPLALVRMARARAADRPLVAGDVEINGDLALGQELQRLAGRLDLDWEELASQLVGDVLARQLGNAARALFGWQRKARQTMEANLGEYLRIETRVLPERRELEGFLNAVDLLRSDADRLEQRLRRLRSRIS